MAGSGECSYTLQRARCLRESIRTSPRVFNIGAAKIRSRVRLLECRKSIGYHTSGLVTRFVTLVAQPYQSVENKLSPPETRLVGKIKYPHAWEAKLFFAWVCTSLTRGSKRHEAQDGVIMNNSMLSWLMRLGSLPPNKSFARGGLTAMLAAPYGKL